MIVIIFTIPLVFSPVVSSPITQKLSFVLIQSSLGVEGNLNFPKMSQIVIALLLLFIVLLTYHIVKSDQHTTYFRTLQQPNYQKWFVGMNFLQDQSLLLTLTAYIKHWIVTWCVMNCNQPIFHNNQSITVIASASASKSLYLPDIYLTKGELPLLKYIKVGCKETVFEFQSAFCTCSTD